MVDGMPMPPPHRILNITTGTVALLLNRMPFHPSKQQPYKFSEFSVLSVDKKWVVGVSPRQVFSCGSWLKKICG